MKKNKGFTLIELLVVIAIIGILSAVVLASLNSARDKSNNAAVKANLNSVRSQAELIFDETNGDYAPVCANAKIIEIVTAATVAAGLTTGFDGALGTAQTSSPMTANCHSDTTGWVISVPLKVAEGTSIFWCVDNKGTGSGKANVLGGPDLICPTS